MRSWFPALNSPAGFSRGGHHFHVCNVLNNVFVLTIFGIKWGAYERRRYLKHNLIGQGVGSRCDRPATAQTEQLEQARAELTGPPLDHSRTGIRTGPTEVDVDGF